MTTITATVLDTGTGSPPDGSAPVLALVSAALAALAVALLLPGDPVQRLRAATDAARCAGGGSGPRPRLWLWLRLRLRRHPRPRQHRPSQDWAAVPGPVVTDLVAAALLTGLPPELAVRAVADVLDGVGDPAAGSLHALARPGADPRPSSQPTGPLAEALELAGRAGLGPVPLVQAAAAEARRRRAARSQVAARRLGTLVVLPTGLCLLPAFILLTVAPLVLDLLLG